MHVSIFVLSSPSRTMGGKSPNLDGKLCKPARGLCNMTRHTVYVDGLMHSVVLCTSAMSKPPLTSRRSPAFLPFLKPAVFVLFAPFFRLFSPSVFPAQPLSTLPRSPVPLPSPFPVLSLPHFPCPARLLFLSPSPLSRPSRSLWQLPRARPTLWTNALSKHSKLFWRQGPFRMQRRNISFASSPSTRNALQFRMPSAPRLRLKNASLLPKTLSANGYPQTDSG